MYICMFVNVSKSSIRSICEHVDHPDAELSEDEAEDGEALDEDGEALDEDAEEDIDDGHDHDV